MKGKLLLVAALTTTILNAYATETKVLKHIEQVAPYTKLTLTTLKNNVNPTLKLKSYYAANNVKTEQFINVTSKVNSISFIPTFNLTIVKANTMYSVWNTSQNSHIYTIGRSICITPKDTDIKNCSNVSDEIYVEPNGQAYVDSEIHSQQKLGAGQSYDVLVGITIQDENNTELFMSHDEQEYTSPINQVTK